LQGRLLPQGIPDDTLLFYSGLLALHPRSAMALRQVLLDFFRVPVEIDQFVGVWRAVEIDSQCELGEDDSFSGCLGKGAVVGDEVWDQQSRIRIRLGPMNLEQYEDFLPEGEAYSRIKSIAGFFAGGEYDMELQLILKRTEVPRCELTTKRNRLGWTSWVKSAELGRDPEDTILEL
jgi:type VI secretion system protein ImpH